MEVQNVKGQIVRPERETSRLKRQTNGVASDKGTNNTVQIVGSTLVTSLLSNYFARKDYNCRT